MTRTSRQAAVPKPVNGFAIWLTVGLLVAAIITATPIAAYGFPTTSSSEEAFRPLPDLEQNPTGPSTTNRFTEGNVVITRNVVTATIGDTVLTADIYQPATPGTGRPAVVLVHGGAWFQGAPSDMDDQGKLVAEQGWVAFSISYRLATTTRSSWPEVLSDVQRGIRWVGANASTYGADPDKIAVLGASAGGHLAAMIAIVGTTDFGALTGQSPPDPNPPVTVKAVAAWSPPTLLADLVGTGGQPPQACGANADCRLFWTVPIIPTFLGCEPNACPDRYKQASPAEQVKPNTTPMWLANSTEEIIPLSQLQVLTDALTRAGVEHEVRILDGREHAGNFTAKVWNDMIPWLAEKLGVPAPRPVTFQGQVGEALKKPLTIAGIVVAVLTVFVLAAAYRRSRHDLVPS
ncbi:MAG: alpha/beta hydrolase [Acidimicrobiales bacterium]|nr:alpha/beta hydrolase [Acidimicrobiales bacterium]